MHNDSGVVVGHARRRPRRIVSTILVILVLVLAVGCGYLYVRYMQAVADKNQNKGRIAAITAHIAPAVLLPSEEPTIATVDDVRKISEPQLAKQAKRGDEILVYAKARRVILYRPSQQKVVDMFRVELPPSTTQLTQ